ANPPADDDLTATAVDGDGSPPPAATYRPTVYLPTGGAPRIVFRAVRGAIWGIGRGTLRATNLGQGSGGAPSASGDPSAIFAQGTAHILYRAVDGAINELTDDGAGNWHWRDIGCGRASADPTAFLDGDLAAVTFQSADGNLHLARLSGGTWSCEDVIPSQAPSGGAGDERRLVKNLVARPGYWATLWMLLAATNTNTTPMTARAAMLGQSSSGLASRRMMPRIRRIM